MKSPKFSMLNREGRRRARRALGRRLGAARTHRNISLRKIAEGEGPIRKPDFATSHLHYIFTVNATSQNLCE